MKTFSSRLKQLRGSASQAEMARKFGVSQVAYGRWEMGKAEPKYDVLVDICKNFSVSSDWLLGIDTAPASAHVTATDGAVAAVNHSTVTASPASGSPDDSRLLGIVEAQQRVIEAQQRTIDSLLNGRK